MIFENQRKDIFLAQNLVDSVLLKICEENKVPVDVLTELVVLQRERQHQERASGVYLRIEEILGRID
jgi:hypothetical protein